MRQIVLENERLRVGVLAGKGSDVVELNYKPRDLDFVWLTAGGVRNPTAYLSTSPDPLATFLDTYPGGWQEIFPNGGAPSSFFGAQFGQHGEVCNLPWNVRLVEETEQAVAAGFAVRTQKSPFLLDKTLRLVAGESTLHLTETVTNESDVPLRAMWGHHLAFGRPFLDETCHIRLPDGVTIIPHPVPIHPDGRRVKPDQRPPWPLAERTDGQPLDLSTLPPRGTLSELVYLTDFREGWYEVVHPAKGIGFRVEWDATVMPYLWYWQEFGASTGYPWYGRHYNIGLEPFSSYPTNGLAEAVANDTALTIGPREERPFWLRATVFEVEDQS
jgi:galactose mutarotase-like enzyme